MPFINAKLTVKLDDNQKNKLQVKLTDAVAEAFSKPKAYIMTEIAHGGSCWRASAIGYAVVCKAGQLHVVGAYFHNRVDKAHLKAIHNA